MNLSRLAPVSRSYNFSPRLAAYIEFAYGSQADARIARAIIKDLQLPRTLLVRKSHANDHADKLVTYGHTLFDQDAESVKRSVQLINRLTGQEHCLVAVKPRHVDTVSEYDRLLSMYSDKEQVLKAIAHLTDAISDAEYSDD